MTNLSSEIYWSLGLISLVGLMLIRQSILAYSDGQSDILKVFLDWTKKNIIISLSIIFIISPFLFPPLFKAILNSKETNLMLNIERSIWPILGFILGQLLAQSKQEKENKENKNAFVEKIFHIQFTVILNLDKVENELKSLARIMREPSNVATTYTTKIQSVARSWKEVLQKINNTNGFLTTESNSFDVGLAYSNLVYVESIKDFISHRISSEIYLREKENEVQLSEKEEESIWDDLESILIFKVQGYEHLLRLVFNIDDSIASKKKNLFKELHQRIKFDRGSLRSIEEHVSRGYIDSRLEYPIQRMNGILEEIENSSVD